MRTVWKFPLQLIDGPQDVMMPVIANVTHAQMQNGIPCFWALVDPDAVTSPRTFVITGTGHPAPTFGFLPVRSFQDGVFMWHLFEKNNAKQ